MAIAEQLTQLDTLRSQLAANLTDKGVETASTEGFATLVPKVGEIQGGEGKADCATGEIFVSTSGSLTLPFEPDLLYLYCTVPASNCIWRYIYKKQIHGYDFVEVDTNNFYTVSRQVQGLYLKVNSTNVSFISGSGTYAGYKWQAKYAYIAIKLP